MGSSGFYSGLTSEQASAFKALWRDLPLCLRNAGLPAHTQLWGVPLTPVGASSHPDKRQVVVLLKFLRPFEFDAARALHSLLECLLWRRDYGVCATMASSSSAEFTSSGCLHGRDLQGNPVMYLKYDQLDLAKVFASHSLTTRYTLWRVQLMERAMLSADFDGATEHVVQVHDFSHMPELKLTAEVKKGMTSLAKLFHDYYPETLLARLLLSIPRPLELLMHVLDRWDPDVHRRTLTVPAGAGGVRSALLTFISPLDIPTCYGGFQRSEFEPRGRGFTQDDVHSATITVGGRHEVLLHVRRPQLLVLWNLITASGRLSVRLTFEPSRPPALSMAGGGSSDAGSGSSIALHSPPSLAGGFGGTGPPGSCVYSAAAGVGSPGRGFAFCSSPPTSPRSSSRMRPAGGGGNGISPIGSPRCGVSDDYGRRSVEATTIFLPTGRSGGGGSNNEFRRKSFDTPSPQPPGSPVGTGGSSHPFHRAPGEASQPHSPLSSSVLEGPRSPHGNSPSHLSHPASRHMASSSCHSSEESNVQDDVSRRDARKQYASSSESCSAAVSSFDNSGWVASAQAPFQRRSIARISPPSPCGGGSVGGDALRYTFDRPYSSKRSGGGIPIVSALRRSSLHLRPACSAHDEFDVGLARMSSSFSCGSSSTSTLRKSVSFCLHDHGRGAGYSPMASPPASPLPNRQYGGGETGSHAETYSARSPDGSSSVRHHEARQYDEGGGGSTAEAMLLSQGAGHRVVHQSGTFRLVLENPARNRMFAQDIKVWWSLRAVEPATQPSATSHQQQHSRR